MTWRRRPEGKRRSGGSAASALEVAGRRLAEALGLGDRRRNWWAEVALLAVAMLVELGVVGVIGHNNPDEPSLGVAGVLLLGLGIAALPFRHRYPVGVLAVAFGTTLAYWSLGYTRGPVWLVLLVALVQAVWAGRRRAAVVTLVAGFLAVPWLGYLIGRADPPEAVAVVALAAWLVALISVAEAVKFRRERSAEAARSEAEALRRQITDERLRIARELHDVIAHNMSLISIQAGVALHLMDDQPEQARTSLAAIKDASKEALVELRSILGVLRLVDEDPAPDPPRGGPGPPASSGSSAAAAPPAVADPSAVSPAAAPSGAAPAADPSAVSPAAAPSAVADPSVAAPAADPSDPSAVADPSAAAPAADPSGAMATGRRRGDHASATSATARSAGSTGAHAAGGAALPLAVDEAPAGSAPRSPVPSLARLGDLVERARAAGLDVRADVDRGVGDLGKLPRAVDLAAFRIVQESLTNVARHSDSPTATVRLSRRGDGLEVAVLDEGSARPGSQAAGADLPQGGSGLTGMRERAASVGGRLQAGPRPGRGFAVRAWLPLTDQARDDDEGRS